MIHLISTHEQATLSSAHDITLRDHWLHFDLPSVLKSAGASNWSTINATLCLTENKVLSLQWGALCLDRHCTVTILPIHWRPHHQGEWHITMALHNFMTRFDRLVCPDKTYYMTLCILYRQHLQDTLPWHTTSHMRPSVHTCSGHTNCLAYVLTSSGHTTA